MAALEPLKSDCRKRVSAPKKISEMILQKKSVLKMHQNGFYILT